MLLYLGFNGQIGEVLRLECPLQFIGCHMPLCKHNFWHSLPGRKRFLRNLGGGIIADQRIRASCR